MLDDRYSNGADWVLKSGSAEPLGFQAFCKSLEPPGNHFEISRLKDSCP